MKGSLKIEAINDDVYQASRAYSMLANLLVPGLGDQTFGKPKAPYWVAQITDFDERYKYKRGFLRGKKDYTHANRRGSRGVYVYFLLDDDKVYEVKTHKRRFFCTVDQNGEIEEITQSEVDQWINRNLVLPY